LNGDSPATAARELHAAGADVVGANCSEGPSQLLRILGAMRAAAPAARLSVMPNAGWPERAAGRILYPATPEYFAGYAAAYSAAGASILGGCCGTTPAHIAAMRQALDSAPARAPTIIPLRLEHAEPAATPLQPSPLASSPWNSSWPSRWIRPGPFSTARGRRQAVAEAGADVPTSPTA
jgi:homocysteine S-methyltransferase